MLKILHIGMPLMPGIARALSKLGEYFFLDWTAYMEYGEVGQGLLHKELVRASNEIKQDVTFFHVQRPGIITPELLKQLPGIKINYTYDVAVPIPLWYADVAPYCTTVFCDENGVREFENLGMRTLFALPAFDQEQFSKNGDTNDYGEIVFLGNHYHDEQGFHNTKLRLEMVNSLKERYGSKFRVYGNGWRFDDGNLMFKENKEAECYRSCEIAINVSHFDLDRYTSDRMFRIMGSGAFCLSKSYPKMEVDFVDGFHLRTWNNIEDLCNLIDKYLDDEKERLRIAANGYDLVMRTGTWDVRMKQIIDEAWAISR